MINVSFIVIAYNEEKNIAYCIKSIEKQYKLEKNYEIIIVDDGSKDNTTKIINELKKKNHAIKIVTDGKNHGRGYSRYIGTKLVKGDYIAMIDADIILPAKWLFTCLKYIKHYDVVGGIALPYGDVAYIHQKFRLKLKKIKGSVIITGNNGLYNRAILKKVNFNKQLREGEDVDFNYHLISKGFTNFCIQQLIVKHQEHKSFIRSLNYFYESGIGATRQLINFKKIRMPDIAFISTLLFTIIALIASMKTNNNILFILPLVCLIVTSFMHLQSKFNLTSYNKIIILGASLANAILIICYYIGRIVGPFLYIKKFKIKTNR